ncbi:MAG: hypothetical protein ACI82A_002344 [Candidatus Azotimanducaceae bacterium]|jgi:hypothetical protein
MIKNLIILALTTISGVFAWTLYEMQTSTGAEIVDQPAAMATTTKTAPKTQSPTPTETASTPNADQSVHLVSIGDGDYETLATQLRDAGYEESLLRQIVLATLNRDHLLAEANEFKALYWQAADKDSEAKLSLQLDWEADRRQQLLALFGTDIANDPLFEEIFKPLNDSLSFLNSDKQVKLYELQRRDEAKTQRLFADGFTQESREDLQSQRQNLQRQIAELLGTEDAFEYHLRESRLADRIRGGLSEFDYSEQEFRKIFAIRKENEGVESSRFSNRAEYREQREQSEARIRDYLGPTRYENFARSQDPAYRSLQSIGERYGNSTAEINEVYSVAQAAATQIDELRNRNTLNREDRQQRMSEIRSESYAEIERIAGKDTAESVSENSRRLGFGRRISPGG